LKKSVTNLNEKKPPGLERAVVNEITIVQTVIQLKISFQA
jgi:hypothetical protein